MSQSQTPEATYCARHPQVETYLRCSRCETPICPECLVQTPVGARCPQCAELRRLPIYQVGVKWILRGLVAGLAVAAIGGIIVSSVRGFGMLLILLLGYVVGEAVGAAANRKQGPILGWTAVVAMLGGFLLGRAILVALNLSGSLPPTTRLLVGLQLAISLDVLTGLILLVGAGIAYYRLR